MRPTWIFAIALVGGSGCGPEITAGSGTTAASDSTGTPASASASSGAGSAAMETNEPPATTGDVDTTGSADATSSDESSTGAQEVCVDGIFEGTYFSGFESSSLEICDGPAGGVWAEVAGVYPCYEVWLVVEGTLCGPGQYGHLGGYDYLLTGKLVEGPCAEGSCGNRPSGCGPSDQVCGGISECDLVAQDCPEGEKCVPTSSSDGPPWTGSTCVPEPGVGDGPGDPCGTEGFDTCAAGLHCWNEDPLARDGYCVDLCAPDIAPCKTGECVACAGDVDVGMCLPGRCGVGRCGC